jgi:hypothetical protein
VDSSWLYDYVRMQASFSPVRMLEPGGLYSPSHEVGDGQADQDRNQDQDLDLVIGGGKGGGGLDRTTWRCGEVVRLSPLPY